MSRSWDSYVGPLCTSPVSSLEQRPFRLMVVRRISALPTRFILGQEPSCGLSFSPTRPARSGACRIPVKNTPCPAQLRFCLHTPLSPMRLPSALSVFPLFSNTGTYQPFFCLRPFSGKILSGRMPAVMRQAGQNLPGVLEGILQAKSAQATTPITDCLWFRRFDIHDSFLPHHLQPSHSGSIRHILQCGGDHLGTK